MSAKDRKSQRKSPQQQAGQPPGGEGGQHGEAEEAGRSKAHDAAVIGRSRQDRIK